MSDEQELTEQDLPSSEEQTYRETLRGIRSFMGWTHVPDVDSSNPSDNNPFAGPKAPAPSKVSVHMPTEDWLCKKLNKLNITLVEGYPSRTAEAGRKILRDDSSNEASARTQTFPHDQPRTSSHINDNHCIDRLQE